MGTETATSILQALLEYYPGLPDIEYTKKQVIFMKRKDKEDRTREDPIREIIFFGIKLSKEEDLGITPGYHRRLKEDPETLEFLTTILYENSNDFRQAISDIRILLKSPTFHGTKKMRDKKLARIAQKRMQHPEMSFRRGLLSCLFCETINSRERGKTYACYLTEPYGKTGFSDRTTFGKCVHCRKPLPIWRHCTPCAHLFFENQGRNIFTLCMECPYKDHQKALIDTVQCEKCDGPPQLRIRFYHPRL